MANNNNNTKTPTNKPITTTTPSTPRRPTRRTQQTNINAAFETPPRPVRRSPPRYATRRRLNFNNANFMRFLNAVLNNTPRAPSTPAQRTPAKRAKKNNDKK